MTNAVWKSPRLLKTSELPQDAQSSSNHPIGSGERFKIDLLGYLRCYDSRGPRCKVLIDQLSHYEFSTIRAALVASVPGRHDSNDTSQTQWGWPALRNCLQRVPCQVQTESEIVIQISSIATLGAKDDWLKTFLNSISRSQNRGLVQPKFKVVFPTADEIRRSLDGYASGGSIHTKIQSSQQAKQLEYLRPLLHHWGNDSPNGRGENQAVF